MNLQTKLFPWSVVLNLILIALIFWMWYENRRNGESAARDRKLLIAGKHHADSIAAHWEAQASTERHEREKDGAKAVEKEKRLLSDLNASKRRERRSRLDTVKLTLVDTIYAEYDTILANADHRRITDSLSFEREIGHLKQSKLVIQVAYDSTFSDLLRVNDALIVTEKKLTRMEKIAKALGISAGTLAVVVTILAIAL